MATTGVLVHRLTAADQPSNARAELDRQPGVGAAHGCASVSDTSGPQCFRTTAQGTGLGLAIAVGQARLPSAGPPGCSGEPPEGRALPPRR
ncbi:hypothetical protein [Streptomyces sp. NRRL S-646]|uniref:hypothetical protein n=1 Tax=Streptomyces sp. NRRL S-646 TaxID=1463917 RepID=UPI000A721F97|nr:hypothetical protein [Streptomyces sp. NRRL S-646]